MAYILKRPGAQGHPARAFLAPVEWYKEPLACPRTAEPARTANKETNDLRAIFPE